MAKKAIAENNDAEDGFLRVDHDLTSLVQKGCESYLGPLCKQYAELTAEEKKVLYGDDAVPVVFTNLNKHSSFEMNQNEYLERNIFYKSCPVAVNVPQGAFRKLSHVKFESSSSESEKSQSPKKKEKETKKGSDSDDDEGSSTEEIKKQPAKDP